MTSYFTALPLSVAIFLVGVGQTVFAGEAEDVADAFSKAISNDSDATVTYGATNASGNTVTIDKVSIKEPATGNVVMVDQAVLTDPKKGDMGNYNVSKIVMTGGVMEGEGSLAIEIATVTDAVLLSEESVEAAGLDSSIIYDTLEIEGIQITPPEKTDPISVEKVTFDAEVSDDFHITGGTGSIDAISLPMDLFAESNTKPADLGYSDVTLDASWNGRLDRATSVMDVNALSVTLREGGTLTLTGRIGNFPESWPTTDGGADAMAPLAGLSVEAIELSYKDNSLAGRILDHQAKAQGMTREQFVQQMGAALPFLLNVLNNPAFQTQVAGALGAFLADPQSLIVTASPATPVTGAELFGLVAAAPQSIPDRLNVTITANGAN